MQIVINIKPQIVDTLNNENEWTALLLAELQDIINNGKPLPKGHGRLLDEKDILDIEKNEGLMYDLVDMPDYIADVSAIIEADTESEGA